MPKLLLVDDNRVQMEVLKAILSAAGHEVVTTDQPKEALFLALTHQPDVIIADIKMPEMNGFELTRRIKSDRKTRGITVLLYSAIEKSGNVFGKALEAGAEDFIRIPSEDGEIVARMEVCIARRKMAVALEEKVTDLERFQAATIDREKRVLELKEEIRRLKKLLEKQG